MNKVIQGDCLEKLKDLEDNSVDSIVTDPPYGLVSITKRFGKQGSSIVQRLQKLKGIKGWKDLLIHIQLSNP